MNLCRVFVVSVILATRALLSLVLPELLPASCYAKCESFPKSVMHLRFFDFNIFTCLKKPVISWTFDPLPTRYSGSLWVVLRLAFCFSLQFSAALSHLLFGLCLTDWRVCADGIFLASLRCFLNDHSIFDPWPLGTPGYLSASAVLYRRSYTCIQTQKALANALDELWISTSLRMVYAMLP